MIKHAYLIIAHNDFELLKKSIELIDDVRNDIYVHIDKKVKDFNVNSLKNCVKYSKIYVYNNFDIIWGNESQVYCEIFLLKQANLNEKYSYYHILSGVDLPIKNQDTIHKFFEENDGKEFVHFDSTNVTVETQNRVYYRHLLSSYFKKYKNKILNKFIFVLDELLINIQHMVKFKKKIQFEQIQKGCNWCSITNNFVEYIIANEHKIKSLVSYSKCGDEVFIQTLIVNSKFIDNLYQNEMNNDYLSCARLIIWDNPKTPHTFTENDFELILYSKAMFGRKFSSKIDSEIINKLYKFIKNKNI